MMQKLDKTAQKKIKVPARVKSDLFKDMVFFIEMYRNGQCMNDCFKHWVKENGAKTTHFWSK